MGTTMSTASTAPFKYIDLFAGIGGFAAALEAFGGECVYSVEIDRQAAAVYKLNHGVSPLGDITQLANESTVAFSDHTVLTAGFPCQPFSKSGGQLGMDEARGTLFWNILKIIEARRPPVVLLENVRNLAGPRHKHEWDVIIKTLRDEGYRVSATPAVFSPHLLPLERGGRPQVRERVFISATYDPNGILDGVPAEPPLLNLSMREGEEWSLSADLPLDAKPVAGTELSQDEICWLEAWADFVSTMWPAVRSAHEDPNKPATLPGFPIWVDRWIKMESLERWIAGTGPAPYRQSLDLPESWDDVPAWKQNFLLKNAAFYTRYKAQLDAWIRRHDLDSFPASRRKLEWQAQQTESLWDCVLQLRPSGTRAKRPTHLPALVAITQTSIIGSLRRRLSTREAARLQGLPDNFDFGGQSDAATYRQLGNGVNVGAVWSMLRAHMARDRTVLESTVEGRALLAAILHDAPKTPDDRLEAVVARGQSRFAEKMLPVAV